MRYFTLVLPLLLAACATTGPGDSGGIAIDTTSNNQVISGAQCVVSNNNGSWTVLTPAVVNTGGVNGDLRVVCNRSGFRTSEFVFRPTPMTSGSRLGLGLGGGGGRIGGSLGISVPIGTGGGGTYPPRVTVAMTPL